MADESALSFAGLLRQLRDAAGLTQEELAEAARLSPRSVSDLERGINRTARKDTALLLADALGLIQPVREPFVEAARGRSPVADVLTAMSGLRNNLPAPVDSFIGRRAELAEVTAAVLADRLVTADWPRWQWQDEARAGGWREARVSVPGGRLVGPAGDRPRRQPPV